MSDGGFYVLLCFVFAAVGGVGGAAAVLGYWRYHRIETRRVVVEGEPVTVRLNVQVNLQEPGPVAVRLITPGSVPVEIEPTVMQPGGQALAERVLAEAPSIGPRALARVVGCSPSTAQSYINRAATAAQAAPPAAAGSQEAEG